MITQPKLNETKIELNTTETKNRTNSERKRRKARKATKANRYAENKPHFEKERDN